MQFNGRATESLFAYFAQMKQWELQCLSADQQLRKRGASVDEWEALTDAQFSALKEIYSNYVVSLPDRSDGFSYGNPTEYDPDTEEIVSEDERKDRAEVVTRSRSSLRQGEVVRYRLLQCDGQWKIHEKHVQKSGNRWKKEPL